MINPNTGVIEDTETGGISVSEVSSKLGVGSLDIATLCRGNYIPEKNTSIKNFNSTNINLFTQHKPFEYNSYQKLEDWEYVKSTYGINMCDKLYFDTKQNGKYILNHNIPGTSIPIYYVGGKTADEVFKMATNELVSNRYTNESRYAEWDEKVWNLPTTKYRLLDFNGYDSVSSFPYEFNFKEPSTYYEGYEIVKSKWPEMEIRGIIQSPNVTFQITHKGNDNSINFDKIIKDKYPLNNVTYNIGIAYRTADMLETEQTKYSNTINPINVSTFTGGEKELNFNEIMPGVTRGVFCINKSAGAQASEINNFADYIYLHKGYFNILYSRVKVPIYIKMSLKPSKDDFNPCLKPITKGPKNDEEIIGIIMGNTCFIIPDDKNASNPKDGINNGIYEGDYKYNIPISMQLNAFGIMRLKIYCFENTHDPSEDIGPDTKGYICTCEWPSNSSIKHVKDKLNDSGSYNGANYGAIHYPLPQNSGSTGVIHSPLKYGYRTISLKNITDPNKPIEDCYFNQSDGYISGKKIKCIKIVPELIDEDTIKYGGSDGQDHTWDHIGRILYNWELDSNYAGTNKYPYDKENNPMRFNNILYTDPYSPDPARIKVSWIMNYDSPGISGLL